ncbi:hypothetical protein Tco_0669093 [Tanacetum coccineum]
MTTMAENVIAAGADNRPLMLKKSMYNSWQSRMLLYIRGKEHDKDLLDSVLHGPFQYGIVVENGITRLRTYEELTDKEKIRDECDIRATNIFLQGLPSDVYNLVNHHTVAKEIWDRVKLLMEGTELSLKFVTDVKLAKDMHESNFDKLYAYLRQHEVHANEVCMMRERFPYRLALITNYDHTPSYYNNHQPQYNPSQYQQHLSPVDQQFYLSIPQPQSYEAPVPQQPYHVLVIHSPLMVPQQAYQALAVQQEPQAVFPQLDSSLAVPSFLPGDDPITSLNKAMEFISIVIASCYPTTHNQLRTSSNPRNQATIYDGRVTVQNVQGRQSQSFRGNGSKSNATSTRGNRNVGTNAANQTRVICYYNCQGECHMARQCTQPKRPRNSEWFKEKMLLVQTDDLDVFDSDCDEAPSTRVVLIANLSSYESDVLLEDFDKGLHVEINEMKSIFNQMESKVEQCFLEKKCFDIQKKELFLENDRLLELIISQDMIHAAINSYAAIVDYKKMEMSFMDEYNECLELKVKLLKKNEMVEKVIYNKLSKRCSRIENHCISLEIKKQQLKECLQSNKPCQNQDAPEFHEFFEINNLKAQLKGKNMTISNLKKHIANLKEKTAADCCEFLNNSRVITPEMYKLDLQPFSSTLRKNKKVHEDYLKVTKEHADTLC